MDKCKLYFCTGCGLCVPEQKAEIEENCKGFYRPFSGDNAWLDKICPSKSCQERQRDKSKIWGREKGVYTGWSEDEELRVRASSGGILTELCSYLLERRYVDCVIHTGVKTGDPTKTETLFSYSRDDLLRGCGSRYAISHPLEQIHKIDKSMKYAFVGKPCDITALKNYCVLNPEYEEVIPYMFSFFCMGLPSAMAQAELLESLKCSKGRLKSLSYRGNGWPGYATATDVDGNSYSMDYDSSWGRILGRDLMPMCRFCIDGIGELADISCGDCWHQKKDGTPDFSEHDGRNVIFARTDKGLDILANVSADRKIHMEKLNGFDEILQNIQRSQHERRLTMRARVIGLRLMGRQAPNYSLKLLSSYAKGCPKMKEIRTCMGMCKRIIKGDI